MDSREPREDHELAACPNVLCDLSRPFLNETDGDLDATHTWVSCENCGACGPRIENPSQYYGRTEHWNEVKRLAVEGWNRRPSPVAESTPTDATAVEAEREACAKECDRLAAQPCNGDYELAAAICAFEEAAAAIRGRITKES